MGLVRHARQFFLNGVRTGSHPTLVRRPSPTRKDPSRKTPFVAVRSAVFRSPSDPPTVSSTTWSTVTTATVFVRPELFPQRLDSFTTCSFCSTSSAIALSGGIACAKSSPEPFTNEVTTWQIVIKRIERTRVPIERQSCTKTSLGSDPDAAVDFGRVTSAGANPLRFLSRVNVTDFGQLYRIIDP